MNKTTLRDIQITVRFLPGHLLYGCPDHVSIVPKCSPPSVRNFHKLVGVANRNHVMIIRTEELV
jgi:hypothetical protein